jgi:Holliday junction resolvasome RuvABC endonuclease subunit
MKILSLDLGRNTGWALGNKFALLSGTQRFENDRFSGGGMLYVRFERWLDDLYGTGNFGEVVFEEVRAHKGTNAAHLYGGFMAMLTRWCEQQGLPYQGIPVGTIKRFATGKGNANKEAVIAAVRKLGFEPQDDNEADAIALLFCHAEGFEKT